MAITKDKKAQILEKLAEVAKNPSSVFVGFNGLGVEDTTAMRKKLTEDGVSYFVAKKTLIKKAYDRAKHEGEMPELPGEVAVAYSDDLTASAQGVYAFQKQYADNISILGGVFEGSFRDKSGMEEIAQIPSHDVLKGMFVNVINSPIQGFVMTLKAYAEKQEA